MIFAAGLGTRLQPLTLNTPKALVSINNIPILELVIKKLIDEGFKEFVINVHHFPDQIRTFLTQKNNFGVTINISDESGELLETGGGISKAREFLLGNEDFLVYNVDILTDFDTRLLADAHKKNNSLATLAVHKRNADRRLVFDSQNLLSYWENIMTGEQKQARKPVGKTNSFSFTGIHFISPKIFNYITETGKFSIIDLYLRLAENHRICAFETKPGYWFDIGKPENLASAEKFLSDKHSKI